jgi:polar amino acid transport system substrate-binding protein
MLWGWLTLGMVWGVQTTAPPLFAADLETIKARGYVVVGVREHWRPLSFRNPQGELVGLEIDLAHQLAQRIFNRPGAVVLQPVSHQERIPALLADQVDLVIAGLTVTASRRRLVHFSLPYYLDGAGLLVSDSAWQRASQLQAGTLGALQGSSSLAVLRYHLPNANLLPLATYHQGFTALTTGQIDALAADLSVLVGWQQQQQQGYRLLPDRLSAEPLAIALPKGQQFRSLHTLVNQTIDGWYTSGWLAQRIDLWGLP